MTRQEFIKKVNEVNAEAHTKEVWAVAKKLFGTRIESMYELVDDQSDSDEPLVSYKNGELKNYDESDIDSDFFSEEHDSPRTFGQVTGLLEPIQNAENWSKQDYFTFGYTGFGGYWFYNNMDGSQFEVLGDYKKAIEKLKEVATKKAKNGTNIGGYEAEFQKLKGGERDLYGMFKDEILSEEDDNFEGWYKNFTNTREPDTNKTIFKVWQEITGTKPTKETFEQLWNHFKKNKQAKNGANIGGNNEYSVGGL
jgi:hypothetical protein